MRDTVWVLHSIARRLLSLYVVWTGHMVIYTQSFRYMKHTGKTSFHMHYIRFTCGYTSFRCDRAARHREIWDFARTKPKKNIGIMTVTSPYLIKTAAQKLKAVIIYRAMYLVSVTTSMLISTPSLNATACATLVVNPCDWTFAHVTKPYSFSIYPKVISYTIQATHLSDFNARSGHLHRAVVG